MGMVKQDDGWRLPERLRVQMEPFLPPRKPHPPSCQNLRIYMASDSINDV